MPALGRLVRSPLPRCVLEHSGFWNVLPASGGDAYQRAELTGTRSVRCQSPLLHVQAAVHHLCDLLVIAVIPHTDFGLCSLHNATKLL